MEQTIVKELESAANELIGSTVPRPSGQLAGHAGGLPFEGLLEAKLEERFPHRAFRHYEALNQHLLNYSRRLDKELKNIQFGSSSLHFLVARGKSALQKWSPDNRFEEKQNDTAESVVFSDAHSYFDSPWVSLIDVKSQRADQKSQAPNIISAVKMSKLAKIVLTHPEEPINFEILYAGIKFMPENEGSNKVLRCTETRVVDLMKVNPAMLYINWAAATQIQFHPIEINQSFSGSQQEWFISYLQTYIDSLRNHLSKQQRKIDEIESLLASIA